MSKDPIGFDAGDTNLYRMTGNHPNMATDPSGLFENDSPDVANVKPTEQLNNALYWARQYVKTSARISDIEQLMATMMRNNHRISRQSKTIQGMERQIRVWKGDLDTFANKLAVDYADLEVPSVSRQRNGDEVWRDSFEGGIGGSKAFELAIWLEEHKVQLGQKYSYGGGLGNETLTIGLTVGTGGVAFLGKTMAGASLRIAAAAAAKEAARDLAGPLALLRPVRTTQVPGGKFDYLFGNATGAKNAAHNAPRTAQNAAQMKRLGLYDDAVGRGHLQRHFDDVVNDSTNITGSYSNKFGNFETRESLFAGPSGQFSKFESTWEILSDGTRRLTTVIPFGGR